MEKKQIEKEDGRTLVYYHFADSASESQTAAFAEVDAPSEPLAGAGAPAEKETVAIAENNADV